MDEIPLTKIYYSISEVAQLTGVESYILRYWEKEFPMLKPKTHKAGRRSYRLEEIKLILMIKKLLYEEHYTIKGARARLREIKTSDADQLELPLEAMKRKQTLSGIKRDIREAIEALRK
ncbi:MAG: MerR family transcriptional regulator [Candidatus Edwardsbacteria bacterium]